MSRKHFRPSHFVSIEKIFTDFSTLYFTGVDETHRSQLVRILDFRPHLLVANPENHGSEAFHAILNNEFITQEDEEDYIVQVKNEYRTPFYGFTHGRKDPMSRIYIRDLKSLKRVKEKLEKTYTLFHHDLSPALMFLHDMNLRYGDWISLDTDTSGINYMKIEQIQKVDKSDISMLMKCFIRHTSIAQAVFSNDHPPYLEADVTNDFDRVVSVSMDFTWINYAPAEHVLITLLPPLFPTNDKLHIIYCQTEEELLHTVHDKIQEWTPEDIIQCIDNGAHNDTLLYLFKRAQQLNMPINPIAKLEWTENVKLYQEKYQLRTRNLYDIAYFIVRKNMILVEMYTLYEFCTMKAIVKQPRSLNDLPWEKHLVNQWWNEGPSGWTKIQQRLLLENELMRQVESDMNLRVELHETQKTNYTDFSHVANRGEQIKATNAVWHAIHYNNYYLNPKLRKTEEPLLVKLCDFPPTFPPVTNIPINEESRKRKMVKYQSLLPPSNKKKKVKSTLEEDACQGGNVVVPTPDFYQHDIIAVLDFQSLYPNIIRHANISHDKLVYELCYNAIPGVRYATIAVDSVHGIRFAQDDEGIIAKVETQTLAKRKEAKKIMAQQTDPFLYSVYDYKQQSLKILCNAIYGAMGADTDKFFLSLRPLMTAVTSVGRYLQTRTSDYLASRYGLITVYGDTDSVMCIMKTFPELSSLEERLLAMQNHYLMPPNFLTSFTPYDDNPEYTLRSALFTIMAKLCSEVDAMFGKPIVLEPENIALNMMLTHLKKHYWYQCVEAGEPTKVIIIFLFHNLTHEQIKKIKCQGMANKKRGWCIWMKELMDKCIDLMAKNKTSELSPLIESYLQQLVTRQVPWQKLVVSRKYKGPIGTPDGYKTENNNIYQLSKIIHQLKGQPLTPLERIKFLVRQGPEPFYRRSVCINYTPDPSSIRVDVLYYLEKQFYKNLHHLCLYHQDHVNIDKLYHQYYQIAEQNNRGEYSL
jgi:DNA polymerase elongation subunit (family B)